MKETTSNLVWYESIYNWMRVLVCIRAVHGYKYVNTNSNNINNNSCRSN